MSNPKVKSVQQIIVGPDVDAFHFLDSRGNVIGWIDGTGALQGALTANIGTNTGHLQGNPISPIPPQPNQTLIWNGSAWVPGAIPISISTNFSDSEVPSGVIDGLNRVFILSNVPTPARSLQLFKNGMRMTNGSDYTLFGAIVTYTVAATPQVGDVHDSSYRY